MDNNVVTGLSAQRDAVNGATSSRGLAERGRALEEKYFHDRDRELLDALRKQAPATDSNARDEGKFDNCNCCPNPHSDRLLEELYFEAESRRAIEALKRGSK